MARANSLRRLCGIGFAAALVAFFRTTGPSILAQSKESQRPAPFFSVLPHYTYKEPLREIEDVDFRNLTVPLFKPDGKCCYYSAKLANGRSFMRSATETDDVVLRSVSYFDFSSQKLAARHAGAAKFAVAVYGWVSTGGSASGYGAANLYTVADNRLVLLQQIDFIAKTPGSGAFFNPATKTLLIFANSYAANDPHCCPSWRDIITFRWTGHLFREAEIRKVPHAATSGI